MSKIHYKHNQLTDYNYSFCDDSDLEHNQENYNHNASPHSHLEIIEKIILVSFSILIIEKNKEINRSNSLKKAKEMILFIILTSDIVATESNHSLATL